MTTEIHGHNEPQFEPVREAFLANFAAGDEVGAAVAVTVNGEFAVDLWGGHTDATRTDPWRENTIVNVFSCTKAMNALCAHILVDRGRLDVNQPIAHYWPEFAANGKEGILVRHALSHQAGLPEFEGESTFEPTIDWQWTVDNLANATPAWPAGSQLAYHGFTFGTLVGEIVRRISGKSLGTFFREEVAGPLGADFHIGRPESEHPRVAQIIDPEARLAEISASNGYGNARALARVISLLANGGELDGVRLLKRETIEAAITGQVYAMDATLGRPYHRALGYILMSPELSAPMGLPAAFYDDSARMPRIFGHDGRGGAQVFCDLERNVAWSYTMNNMTGDEGCNARVARLMQAIAPCIAQ